MPTETALAHLRLIGQYRKRKIVCVMAVDPLVKATERVVSGSSAPGAAWASRPLPRGQPSSRTSSSASAHVAPRDLQAGSSQRACNLLNQCGHDRENHRRANISRVQALKSSITSRLPEGPERKRDYSRQRSTCLVSRSDAQAKNYESDDPGAQQADDPDDQRSAHFGVDPRSSCVVSEVRDFWR